MKQQALAILGKLRAFWTAMSKARKITTAIIASSVIAAAVTLWAVSSYQSYDYLFTDLSTEDAAAIVGKLGELKVPYRIEASGTAVLVPADKVHEVRLQIAGAGLPRGGGVGFELFDKTRFGTTEFEQQVNLRRALEGELSRTIMTIAAVRTARVHLVLPERTVFLKGREAGSASVVLQMHAGRSFGKRETNSIVHLVASAVPGLSPNQVSVVTTDGTTLHSPSEAGAPGGGGDSLLDREAELAGQFESRVRAQLERAVGAGRVDVRVGVQLDSSAREVAEEHYDPKSTVMLSESRVREGSGLDEAGPTGVPGSKSNLPGEAEPEPDTGSPDDEPAAEPEPGAASGVVKESSVRNWVTDKVTSRTTIPPGKVARLTVAVMVDGIHKPLPGGGQEYAERSPEELQQLGKLVKGTVGFDQSRGDTVELASVRFFNPADEAAAEAPPGLAKPKWLQWPYLAGAGTVGALALATTVWRLRRRKNAKQTGLARTITTDSGTTADGTPDVMTELSGGRLADLPQAPGRDPQEVRDAAIEFATRDPATAAVILREWINATAAIPAASATAPELPRS